MKESVKPLTAFVSVAAEAAAVMPTPASAQQGRVCELHCNSDHEIRTGPDHPDPGSHLGCPPTPVHDNTPPLGA